MPGDHITADLGRTFSVTRICIVDARPLGSGILPREWVGKVNISDVLQKADLKYSLDGLEWHTLTPISYRCIDYRISPTNMRYIRLLVTAS